MSNILITGANKGIGLQLVEQFAARGDKVYACCRNPSAADALNTLSQNHDIEVIQLEVGQQTSVDALAARLKDTAIDTLINNAGVGGPAKQSAFEVDFEGWAEAFNINSMAPVRVMHALLPNLRLSSDAKVLSVSSQLGALSLDMTMAYAYSASKAALNKYMRMAAIEMAKEDIQVSVIHPGWVQTDMGGAGADITPTESAAGIIAVIGQMNLDNTGAFWKWNGERHDW